MAIDSKINGLTGNVVESTNNQLHVRPETQVIANPDNVGAVKVYHENDEGYITGNKILKASEIDVDYRMRVSQDTLLDEEVFCYTAQNTGKHSLSTTTMAASFTAGQFTTNSGSITTINTGILFNTYADFACWGTATTSVDAEIAFSQQPVTNTFVEWGLGYNGTAITDPLDGVFFRLNGAGLQGIASFNGSETSTGLFPALDGAGIWTYANNKRHQFIVYIAAVEAQFWVNYGLGALLLGSIPLPAAQSRMQMGGAGKFFFKHRIVGGAAGGVMQAFLGSYNVRQGGINNISTVTVAGNRAYGSYQGLSGGIMGSLANYANNTNPTAAVPTNTTAALGTGLGGQFWETATLALNTDGIICSFQVPAGTVNAPGRRLVIRGMSLSSDIQTVIAGGPFVNRYSLAFGHTALSLATAETVTTKAPRRIPLPVFKQVVTAAQAVSTLVSQPGETFIDFGDAPIFVNPGEFVALVVKRLGTVGTSGTIAHDVAFVYGWE